MLANIVPMIAPSMCNLPAPLAEAALTDKISELHRLAGRMRDIQSKARHDIARVRALIPLMAGHFTAASAGEIEAVISSLLQHEQELQTAYATKQAFCRRLLLKSRRWSPPFRDVLRQMTEIALSMSLEDMRAVRDARWELMALEAASVPPAEGPILSSAQELQAYLRSLPATA